MLQDIYFLKFLESKQDSNLKEETTTKSPRHSRINTTYIPYLKATEHLKSGLKARLKGMDDSRKLRNHRKNKTNVAKVKSKTKISNQKKIYVLNEPALEVWMDEIYAVFT